jgi:DNA-binding GntR family transcriptional regulator
MGADPAPVFKRQETVSLRDRVYDDIREAILAGTLNPGDRIKERSVAAQMGVSTTPIKEALRRLEQEGLVVSQPRRGAVVGPLVSTSAAEILELRAALEGLAARYAAWRMTDAERVELAETIAETSRNRPPVGREGQRRAIEATSRFHRLVHQGSRSQFLIRFLETLAPFDRTVRRQAVLNVREWPTDVAEHEQITAAIQGRDGVEAERVMNEHIRRVIQFIHQDAGSRDPQVEPPTPS